MPSSGRVRTSRRKFVNFLGQCGLIISVECLAGIGGKVRRAEARPRNLTETSGSQGSDDGTVRVSFVDVASDAGIGGARNTFGGVDSKRFLLEETGCGVAFFDYDCDGWLDIFLINGTTLEGFAHGTEPTSYLFHNNRNGTFTDVTKLAGLAHSGWGQGCCIGDYDNDGFEDLFVTYWGRNVLYHNNGDGTFTDVSERAGIAGGGPRWGTGCCFLDYDRDGFLDLFVANYVNFDPALAPQPGQNQYCQLKGIAVACGPQGLGGGTNILYHNRGNGSFEDVSEKSGVVNPRGPGRPTSVSQNWRAVGSYGFTAVAADFDNDGWPDIYVACDSAPSLLYHNNHDGTFAEIGTMAGCALSADGTTEAGMGVAVGDYDDDGWLDIVKTNFSDDTSNLYHNNGDGTFYDATYKGGLGTNTQYLGWGIGLFDFDNDGWKDIFIANGHVYPEIDRHNLHISYKQRKILYKNRGNGRFEDVSMQSGPGISLSRSSRGCAFGDFDNDGDVDIVINNMNDAPSLLRNDGANKNNWILVKCLGTRSNRSAIGARVRVVTAGHAQIEEVMSGSSHLSQNDLRLHFGLGQASKVDLMEVRWPSGLRESFRDIASNQLIVIQEGTGVTKTQRLGR
jgi:enediyne biosynthesis protein E4